MIFPPQKQHLNWYLDIFTGRLLQLRGGFLSFVEHEKIIWEISQYFFFHTMNINGNQNSLVTNILQNIFCKRKKVILFIQTADLFRN